MQKFKFFSILFLVIFILIGFSDFSNKKGKKVIFHIESALVVKYQMIK